MTILEQRVEAFKQAFPGKRASWPWLVEEQGRQVIYAVWVIGADYRNKTQYYGSYPPGFLDRVMALFPEQRQARTVLHVFSGSLPPGNYVRLDLKSECDVRGSVYDAKRLLKPWGPFELAIADPPYSSVDAEEYGTPMVNRDRATKALAEVVIPGGHLVWLDTCWPMHTKTQWVTVGRILVQRSTNHRARVLSIFERVAA